MFKFANLAFDKLKQTLSKTSESLTETISKFNTNEDKFDEFTLDELEELLIKADLGVESAAYIIDKIKAEKVKPSAIKDFLKKEFKAILSKTNSNSLNFQQGLNVYLVTGVNGAGKTTTIGKMAHMFKNAGKKVLIAAGDTFRAAAEEQLEIWAKRSGADIVRRDKADPASVVFEAIEKAQKENYDVILIDTAGRLQNKFNLMAELKKIKTVIDKKASGAFCESLLVLDANTGQNGLSQASVFTENADLTGVIITKLDGSAKGGIIFSIAKEYKLPAKLIGIGEGIDDLKEFNPDDFIEALFD